MEDGTDVILILCNHLLSSCDYFLALPYLHPGLWRESGHRFRTYPLGLPLLSVVIHMMNLTDTRYDILVPPGIMSRWTRKVTTYLTANLAE